jgi:excisionase family DNA binding protein
MNPEQVLADAEREEQRSEEVWRTVNEYAQEMRVTRRTVERWIRRGLVEAQRIGRRGHWRVRVCRNLSYSNPSR